MTAIKETNASLNDKLAQIQKELKAPKNQRNTFGNYNYRSCEDILEAVKPLLGNLTLLLEDTILHCPSSHAPIIMETLVTDNKTGKSYNRKELINFDRFYIVATASLTDGANTIKVTAYAREEDAKKGMDGAQVTGASSSYARKYALNGLFLIDDTKDADTEQPRAGKTAYIPKRPATYPEKTATPTPKIVNSPAEVEKAIEEIKNPTPQEALDGKVITENVDAFRGNNGEVLRDNLGHTSCISCGAVVSPMVETFSVKKYKKILCMRCQKKEDK